MACLARGCEHERVDVVLGRELLGESPQIVIAAHPEVDLTAWVDAVQEDDEGNGIRAVQRGVRDERRPAFLLAADQIVMVSKGEVHGAREGGRWRRCDRDCKGGREHAEDGAGPAPRVGVGLHGFGC
jgi:hypothetical protein